MDRPRAAPLCEVKVPDVQNLLLITRARWRRSWDWGLYSYQISPWSPITSCFWSISLGYWASRRPCSPTNPSRHLSISFWYPPVIESLFQEAAKLYSKTKEMDFSPYITVEYWWRHCRLDTIQSSLSNIHYDHLVAPHMMIISQPFRLQNSRCYSSRMAIETLAAHSNRAFAKGNGECLCQQSAGNKSFWSGLQLRP